MTARGSNAGSWVRGWVLAACLAVPVVAGAKGATARIEVDRGKTALLTIDGQAAAAFTIWSGPGTFVNDVSAATVTQPGDFADWASGAVTPPKKLRIYRVRFYCSAEGASVSESLPSHQCYGVRYGIDEATGRGYVQIPPANDKEFPGNLQSIYREVEGRWFNSTRPWDELLQPRIEAALAGLAAETRIYEQPYIHAPSPAAVGAKPTLTPKN